MKDLGMSDEEVLSFAMSFRIVDLLTRIPPEQMNKGVAYVHTKIVDFLEDLYEGKPRELKAAHERWNQFWDGYFNK